MLDIDDIIVEDSGSESNSENSELHEQPIKKYKERMAPRTEKQLEMLKAYAPSKTLTTKEKSAAWERLTKKLNNIGPPMHEWTTWRTVWNSYIAKGNSIGCQQKFTKTPDNCVIVSRA